MKIKIRVADNITGKVIEGEKVLPNKAHLYAQMNYRAKVILPKKGKGSFKRIKKVLDF